MGEETPRRWKVTVERFTGDGLQTIYRYPLQITKEQAEERAGILAPGWNLVPCVPHLVTASEDFTA